MSDGSVSLVNKNVPVPHASVVSAENTMGTGLSSTTSEHAVAGGVSQSSSTVTQYVPVLGGVVQMDSSSSFKVFPSKDHVYVYPLPDPPLDADASKYASSPLHKKSEATRSALMGANTFTPTWYSSVGQPLTSNPWTVYTVEVLGETCCTGPLGKPLSHT